ncbi:MAG: hypothetical protein LAO07_07295 [Acidobacteriia bacterium]|nr:hypothetical protein [Terriglobia bacterium]
MIPKEIRTFFWDVNPETFDPVTFPRYTIGRLLEFGDESAVAWMRRTFSEAQILDALRTERRLSRRSANSWALVYRIPPNEVAALQQRSPTDSGPWRPTLHIVD